MLQKTFYLLFARKCPCLFFLEALERKGNLRFLDFPFTSSPRSWLGQTEQQILSTRAVDARRGFQGWIVVAATMLGEVGGFPYPLSTSLRRVRRVTTADYGLDSAWL